MITVRPATLCDLPLLLSAEAACFSDPFSENAIRGFYQNGWGLSLIAEEEGEPLGYLLATLIDGEGEVARVAALPERRRRGAAEALLRHLLSLSESCYLEVRRSNAPARALYEKLGFVPVGERKGYYKSPAEDAVLYERTEKRTEK